MKIVHICISGPYIDGWGYQDNLLPEYLTDHNIDNHIIACSNVFPNYLPKNQIEDIKQKGNHYTFNGITINRIPATKITTTFVIPHGLYNELKNISPDVIFHHGVNSTSLLVASIYAKKNKCILLCDNHADTINISKNSIWNYAYHKLLIRYTIKFLCTNIYKFYGVSHGRCNFLQEYYRIPLKKIDFLPIGADTKTSDLIESKNSLRQKYHFQNDDLIVVSGGKMGIGKGTDLLIRAVSDLNKKGRGIKIILFGKFEDKETENLATENAKFISYQGWCNRQKTLELLKLADIACWPIHHTTLIEDTISVSTPLILRKTSTTEHLIHNNGFWVENNLVDILDKFFSKDIHNDIHNGCIKMRTKLSYNSVANKLLQDINR